MNYTVAHTAAPATVVCLSFLVLAACSRVKDETPAQATRSRYLCTTQQSDAVHHHLSEHTQTNACIESSDIMSTNQVAALMAEDCERRSNLTYDEKITRLVRQAALWRNASSLENGDFCSDMTHLLSRYFDTSAPLNTQCLNQVKQLPPYDVFHIADYALYLDLDWRRVELLYQNGLDSSCDPLIQVWSAKALAFLYKDMDRNNPRIPELFYFCIAESRRHDDDPQFSAAHMGALQGLRWYYMQKKQWHNAIENCREQIHHAEQHPDAPWSLNIIGEAVGDRIESLAGWGKLTDALAALRDAQAMELPEFYKTKFASREYEDYLRSLSH